MTEMLKSPSRIPGIEDGNPEIEGLIDVDGMEEHIFGLESEIDSYRANLKRYILSHSELLGTTGPSFANEPSIKQLLDIKAQIDEEFRRKFRISPEYLQPAEDKRGLDALTALKFRSGN
ncbi:hypothetical protein ISS30_01665 [bacterium]|nr:hypothetical protein [bacterium]